jgi:2-polyprenyl-3-methyl-5-hydroxy-6-metoxy-1,4-benzoquinol methylase
MFESRARDSRSAAEIAHGAKLAEGAPEEIWGWATPAGKRRAIRRAQLISAAASLAPGVRALEVGCGTGMFTEMFARTGASLLAVDISPDLIARARLRGLPEDQVVFRRDRFEDCGVAGPFDAVIGSSVLHHLDVEEGLRKIHALLAPGGVLSFAEPNYLNPQVFAERAFRFLPIFSHVSPDETAFVRFGLRRLLRKVGFAEIAIRPFDWLHPATPARLIGLVERVGRGLEAIPLLREFSGSLLIRARRP